MFPSSLSKHHQDLLCGFLAFGHVTAQGDDQEQSVRPRGGPHHAAGNLLESLSIWDLCVKEARCVHDDNFSPLPGAASFLTVLGDGYSQKGRQYGKWEERQEK